MVLVVNKDVPGEIRIAMAGEIVYLQEMAL